MGLCPAGTARGVRVTVGLFATKRVRSTASGIPKVGHKHPKMGSSSAGIPTRCNARAPKDGPGLGSPSRVTLGVLVPMALD